MTKKILTGIIAGLFLLGGTQGALAGSEIEDALEAGAIRLSAEEIAERLTGKTVTFVSAKSGDSFLVYYGADNQTVGRKVGAEAVLTGFHALTDRDQICLGWQGRDLPRLRCMDVLLIDGKMHKFKADGSLSGHVSESADGNTT